MLPLSGTPMGWDIRIHLCRVSKAQPPLVHTLASSSLSDLELADISSSITEECNFPWELYPKQLYREPSWSLELVESSCHCPVHLPLATHASKPQNEDKLLCLSAGATGMSPTSRFLSFLLFLLVFLPGTCRGRSLLLALHRCTLSVCFPFISQVGEVGWPFSGALETPMASMPSSFLVRNREHSCHLPVVHT